MSGPPSTAINPTWTWGSSAELRITNLSPASVSAQLAQVTLPEPAVCSLYIQAAARIVNPENISISTFTINLSQGLGRVTVPRQVSFAGQPSLDAPLEWTMPFVPLHALQVDVSAQALFRVDDPGEIDIQVYFVLAPLTRIPQKIQKLQFGMALPGEADDLDDELRGELEADGPTVAQIMAQDRQPVDASSPEELDPEQPAEVESATPAWLDPLIDRMTRTLGRQPTVAELSRAVKRVRSRMARRAAR
jgi:hypothetical protein